MLWIIQIINYSNNLLLTSTIKILLMSVWYLFMLRFYFGEEYRSYNNYFNCKKCYKQEGLFKEFIIRGRCL